MSATSLRAYTLRRALESIPLFLSIIVFNFVLFRVAPGDPVALILGEGAASAELVSEITKRLGLDRPLQDQLFSYLVGLFQGDLGFSFTSNRPVSSLILERIPATLLLMATMFIIAAIFGILLGVISALRRGTFVDAAITSGVVGAASLPVFWVGMILLLIFSLILGWFPATGITDTRANYQGLQRILDMIYHLVLPATALAINRLAVTTRITRSSMLEALRQDYITTAKSKGLAWSSVVFRHALRNALLPVATILGFELQWLLAGSALIESVFGWPGVGLLAIQSLYARDYPTIMGVIIVVSVTVIVVNMIMDIGYSLIDPRIRYK